MGLDYPLRYTSLGSKKYEAKLKVLRKLPKPYHIEAISKIDFS